RRHEPAAGMAVLCGRVAAIRLLEDALHRRAALGTQPEETEDGRPVARVVHERERAAHVARVVLRRTRAVEGGTRARRLDAPAKTRDVARVGAGGRPGEAGARRPRRRGERAGDDASQSEFAHPASQSHAFRGRQEENGAEENGAEGWTAAVGAS